MASVREWKPGDVAMIRVGTGDWEYGVRRDDDTWGCRHTRNGFAEHDVTARPLVVIDPEDREQVERLAWAIKSAYWGEETTPVSRGLLDATQAAFRSLANPTPPIEEPTNVGAVVLDAEGADWHLTSGRRWIAEDGLRSRACGWGHINAVRVLSEGVPAEAKS